MKKSSDSEFSEGYYDDSYEESVERGRKSKPQAIVKEQEYDRENDSLSLSYKPQKKEQKYEMLESGIENSQCCFVRKPLPNEREDSSSEFYRGIIKQRINVEKQGLDVEMKKVDNEQKILFFLIDMIDITQDVRMKRLFRNYLFSKLFKSKRKVSHPSRLQCQVIRKLHFDNHMTAKTLVQAFNFDLETIEQVLRKETSRQANRKSTQGTSKKGRRKRQKPEQKKAGGSDEEYKP